MQHTMLKAEFITPEDVRWSSLLQDVKHDFYHIPEYVKIEADQTGRRPAAFYAECGDAKFLIPLLLSQLPAYLNAPDSWLDATTPYGYPCPLLSPGCDDASLSRFLQAFREVSAESGIVSAFLRLHPLLTLPQAVLEEYGRLIRHGQTVYFDLSASEEQMVQHVCGNHRRDIKRLARDGFRVVMDDWAYYPHFIDVYRATMQRLGADEMYFFEGDYFQRLRMAMDDRIHLGTVLSPEGEVVASGIFISTCGIVQYHLGGSADVYVRRSPLKLMVDEVRRWARDRGEKYLHMGGGLGGREDSLFNFKAGFSKERADFYTYRMILDKAKYQMLIDAWHTAGGTIDEHDTFFPLYRRPLV